MIRKSGHRFSEKIMRKKSVHEHHGFPPVEDDAVFQVIADRARQHPPLDVAALAHEIVRRVAMADPLDILVDDRTFVQIARDIVRGGADQLDAALMRLVIGSCTLETRQEGVVDVDAAPASLADNSSDRICM